MISQEMCSKNTNTMPANFLLLAPTRTTMVAITIALSMMQTFGLSHQVYARAVPLQGSRRENGENMVSGGPKSHGQKVVKN